MLDGMDDGARVFIVGPVPRTDALLDVLDMSRRVTAGATESDGSSPAARVFLDGHHPVVSLDRGRLTWAASWFGEGPYTVPDCEFVWSYLSELLAGAWRSDGVELMLTPATTGRDLWLRTITGPGYPVLDQPLQAAIRAGAGQGRIETRPGRGIVTLHEYDARLAYLSLTPKMPVGEPVDLHGADAEAWAAEHPYAPARYLVSFTVPADWGRRPGILPVAVSRTIDPLAGWTWPTERGTIHGPTWCEGSELFIARRYGWSTTVHRVIGWTETADVFATWQRRLMRVLDVGLAHLDGDPTLAAMFRSAVRAMALHTIGALNGSPHRVTHLGASPHDHGQGIRRLRSGVWTWHTVERAAWPQLSHPEWTATIWGRARARLLDAPTGTRGQRIGALHVPAEQLVAFRTDAIYTTQPTGWGDDDDGRPGRYRYKGAHGPGPWPRTGTDVLRMKGANNGSEA